MTVRAEQEIHFSKLSWIFVRSTWTCMILFQTSKKCSPNLPAPAVSGQRRGRKSVLILCWCLIAAYCSPEWLSFRSLRLNIPHVTVKCNKSSFRSWRLSWMYFVLWEKYFLSDNVVIKKYRYEEELPTCFVVILCYVPQSARDRTDLVAHALWPEDCGEVEGIGQAGKGEGIPCHRHPPGPLLPLLSLHIHN